MTRKTLAHWFVASSLVVVALFGGLGQSATPALALTTTTIGFDDLSPGTVVSNQYDAQGVDFESGIVGFNVYCYPVVKKVTFLDAASGDQVADTSCSDGEFPDSSIRGVLTNSAQNLSVEAGFLPSYSNPPASEVVTLTAYDIDGNALGADTAAVPTGTGTHTLLQIASASADVVQFDLTATQPNVAIDDLTFDNPSGLPPDFAVRPESGEAAVAQGSSTQDIIDVNRENGSTGGITFSASGIPTGVHAVFSPNPATGNSTTLTISADTSASLTATSPYPPVTVTGTPDSASAGPAARSQTIGLDVYPNFTVSLAPSLQVPPCSVVKVPITAVWSANPITFQLGFTGDIALAVSGVPANDQASLSPTTVTFPTNGSEEATSTLTISSDSDLNEPSGTITVTGTSGQFSSSGQSNVSVSPPSITSVSPNAGQTAQGINPNQGSLVSVTGRGFCPGTTVYFGNSLAAAQTVGPSADGTTIQAYVPRLATTGRVYAVRSGASLSSTTTAASPDPFNVDSYRDTNGFSFDNSNTFQNHVGGYSFSDVSDVFGYDQTHIGLNPCYPFGNCSFYTPVPDPFALLFWGIANTVLEDGQCFGFSLASQRLIHGDQAFSAFRLQPGATSDTVWNLDGPDAADGPSANLAHFIHLTHMEQLSAEALHYWLVSATANAVSGSQGSIIGDVQTALEDSDHPLIELSHGTSGHVVVAYQVEGEANGDRIIDVYDPNQEYTAAEQTDQTGVEHQAVIANSEIVVHPDGQWTFQGAFSDSPWHGGPGSLVVVPYGTNPVQPTMPFTLSGLVDLLFGSAHVSQVTDAAGHTLLNSDGSLNGSQITGIPAATQFSTLSGGSAPGPDIFLFGKPGAYTQTIVGGKAGPYRDTLFGNGMAATLAAISSTGSVDKVSLPPDVAGLQFGRVKGAKADASQPVTAQLLVHATDGSERTATVDTTMPTAGHDSVSFDPNDDAVSVKGAEPHASYSLMLTSTGPEGTPQTFLTPKLGISAGDTATFAPPNWSALGSQTIEVKTTHGNGNVTTTSVKNQIHTAAGFSLALKVATVKRSSLLQLTINAAFKKVIPGSSALFSWEVFQGTQLVANSTVAVSGKKLHAGHITRKLGFTAAAHSQYKVKGTVTLITPAAGQSYSSVAHAEVKRFHG